MASMKMIRSFFYGIPSSLYTDVNITAKNHNAVIEWLEDRSRFYTWLTSIVTGASVFLVALGPPLAVVSLAGIIKLIGLSLMLFSLLTGIISMWSISNYKLNLKMGKVKTAPKLRLDIEMVTLLSAGSFFIGFTLAIMATIH